MSILYPCYTCLKSKINIENLLCDSCVQVFDDYKFYCCPRCSQMNCNGCENLSEFRSIFSLYFYNSIISKIIVGAKDKFNLNSQKMFEEIFYTSLKTELQEILSHANYNFICLSAYRKARIFHGYWHPNIFFEKIINEIKESHGYNFEIIHTHYTSKKETDVYWLQKKITHPEKPHILLCDDVLTTGISAIKCMNAVNKYLINPTWDLLTLFRSPQKNTGSRGQAAG